MNPRLMIWHWLVNWECSKWMPQSNDSVSPSQLASDFLTCLPWRSGIASQLSYYHSWWSISDSLVGFSTLITELVGYVSEVAIGPTFVAKMKTDPRLWLTPPLERNLALGLNDGCHNYYFIWLKVGSPGRADSLWISPISKKIFLAVK